MTPALNILIRSALDRDAREYCSQTGATERRAISQFFRGMKNEGLWDNSAFWMLPAHQNFGTGTVVKSAGGLGSYDGTLVNGPTWGAIGITFGTSASLTTTLSFAAAPISFVAVFLPASDAGNNTPVLATGGVGVNGRQFMVSNTASANGLNLQTYRGTWASAGPSAGAGTTARVARTWAAMRLSSGTAGRASFNGTHAAMSGGTSWDTGTSGNAGIVNQFVANEVSFVAVVSAYLDDSAADTLRGLYKSTIGQGLGLP